MFYHVHSPGIPGSLVGGAVCGRGTPAGHLQVYRQPGGRSCLWPRHSCWTPPGIQAAWLEELYVATAAGHYRYTGRHMLIRDEIDRIRIRPLRKAGLGSNRRYGKRLLIQPSRENQTRIRLDAITVIFFFYLVMILRKIVIIV